MNLPSAIIPQRLHRTCVLLWRFPKLDVPFAVDTLSASLFLHCIRSSRRWMRTHFVGIWARVTGRVSSISSSLSRRRVDWAISKFSAAPGGARCQEQASAEALGPAQNSSRELPTSTSVAADGTSSPALGWLWAGFGLARLSLSNFCRYRNAMIVRICMRCRREITCDTNTCLCDRSRSVSGVGYVWIQALPLERGQQPKQPSIGSRRHIRAMK